MAEIKCRGTWHDEIITNRISYGDRDKFLSYLKSSHQRYGAVIHAFCLMNNHYHLFMETPKGNLSQIMRHINGAYTNYFKIRHHLERTAASTMLGSDDFIECIKDKYLDRKARDRDVPAVREGKKSPDMAETYKRISAGCNGDASVSKKITLYLYHKYSGEKLREIGAFFGIGESAVSDASRRFGLFLKNNRRMRKEIEVLQDQLDF